VVLIGCLGTTSSGQGTGAGAMTEDGIQPVLRILRQPRSVEEDTANTLLSSALTSFTDVTLTPRRGWQSDLTQADDARPSLLGLSLRVCNPFHALESVYHVLDVLEGSPAEVSLWCAFIFIMKMRRQEVNGRWETRPWRVRRVSRSHKLQGEASGGLIY